MKLAKALVPFCAVLALAPAAMASPAVFQYAVPVATSKGAPAEAFLWLPPDARRTRRRSAAFASPKL